MSVINGSLSSLSRTAVSCARTGVLRLSKAHYGTKSSVEEKTANQVSHLPYEVEQELLDYAESLIKNRKVEFHHCGLSLAGTQAHEIAMRNMMDHIKKVKAQSEKKD